MGALLATVYSDRDTDESEFNDPAPATVRHSIRLSVLAWGKADPAQASLVAALLWWREREITDGLLDLLVRVVHKIGARAEAAVENPEGTVREVLYPVVGEGTLKELVKEYKGSGPAFRLNVHARLRSSYRGHYGKMLSPLLETLELRSNNAVHQPVIDALRLLRRYAGITAKTYPADETIQTEGVVPPGWRFLVIGEYERGQKATLLRHGLTHKKEAPYTREPLWNT